MSQEPPAKKARHEEPGGVDVNPASLPTPTSIYFDPAAAIVAANAPHFTPHRNLMLSFATVPEDKLDNANDLAATNPYWNKESSLPASPASSGNASVSQFTRAVKPRPLEMMRNPPPFELGGGGYSSIGRDSYAEEDVA